MTLLALVLGLYLGRFLPERRAAVIYEETAVPAMAYTGGEETPLFSVDAELTPPPVLAPTPENLFSLTVVSQEGTGETPAVSTAPTPTAAAPAPTAAFAIRVVKTETEAPAKRRVLIYHTHTYEAYEKAASAEYQETQRWRTADENHNVVKVGETLAGLLRGLGFQVEHDRTAFEPPNLSTAYARSLEMLETRRAAGEEYDLYIDLHRDAYPASASGSNTVWAGSAELARLMLLVGKGEGQTSQGFSEKPDWGANLAIAQAITDTINAQVDGLCKDVMLKTGRYNQHVAVGCVLIEAGNNMNTLEQVLLAMPYLADAIDQAITDGQMDDAHEAREAP